MAKKKEPKQVAPEKTVVEIPKVVQAEKTEEPKEKRPIQNGVARPNAGTRTGYVWAIADELSGTLKRPPTVKELVDAIVAVDASFNRSTINTQFAAWRKFYGIKSEPKAA